MDPPVDLINLTHEELQEEYSKLLKRYKQLREISETDAQRIHDLKRSLDTATAAEAFLAQELEQLNSSLNKAEQNTQTKMEHKLEDQRIKYNGILAENLKLQQDCDALQRKNSELLEKLDKVSTNTAPEVFEPETEHQLKREQQLEQENIWLLEKLEGFQDSTVQYTMTLAEREKNIEILRDQVMCLEENMRCKREELEEVTQLLESTQEQLMESNAKIALLTAAPGNCDKKGNSLFAEVDDQRQAMKQLLAAQKKSYMHMKKQYNESEHEIRRLKRENIAMHTELQKCSSIFCSSERTYQEKLNQRNRQLLNQNEELARKLNWTQDRLKEVASDKGVLWLDSMLKFCKQETDELKKHLHSVRINNASLEEQLRNTQQEMARWRFESLKSRCVLLDRENLLTENKINFKPIIAMEITIGKQELESSRPRIHSVSPNNTTRLLARDSAEASPNFNTELKEKTFKNVSLPENQVTKIEKNEKTHIENVHDTNIKSIEETNACNVENTVCSIATQLQKVPIEIIQIEDDCELANPHAATTKLQSILCKNMSLIPKEINKTVKFSANQCKSIDGTPANNKCSNASATPKKLPKKSNVIVRQFIVKSKHES